ncbi:unnamed protein product [Soboliphyme baturini]|uniref:Fasciculation and elongation protein zeta-2 n=1 Tax=Soboliphyme baturini TaxID=241478 RepID=A0A183IHW8_9BILA|nr:unnamed protein product [Soboliphyme baturini]
MPIINYVICVAFCLELKTLTYKKLLALHAELEALIQLYNETLVQELALRDELEYQKELKNTFISLLLSIQHKRRQWLNEQKRKGARSLLSGGNGCQPQYMISVIPFHEGAGVPDNVTFQALIKILRAVNADNPNVPSLLTDYILNGTCEVVS